MTTNNNNQNSTAEQRDKALEEAVRLAEKRLELLRSSIAKLEGKAVLLITACVALIGYLLSTDVKLTLECSWQATLDFIRIISLILLACAAFIGGLALDLGEVGPVGMRPRRSKSIIDNEKSMPVTRLYERVMDEYKKATPKTSKTAKKKIITLLLAKCLFLWGIGFAVFGEIGNIIAPVLISIIGVISNIYCYFAVCLVG